MERLTYLTKDSWGIKGNIDNAVIRLAEIEDILGNEYDLDRLRELVEADQIVGKTLWITKWFGPGVKIANPPISRVVISFSRLKNGEILLHLKDGAFPMKLLEDCAYKTRKQAEAALNETKEAESE